MIGIEEITQFKTPDGKIHPTLQAAQQWLAQVALMQAIEREFSTTHPVDRDSVLEFIGNHQDEIEAYFEALAQWKASLES